MEDREGNTVKVRDGRGKGRKQKVRLKGKFPDRFTQGVHLYFGASDQERSWNGATSYTLHQIQLGFEKQSRGGGLYTNLITTRASFVR